MTSTMTIYERLAVMSVTSSRVIDERTLPGSIAHELPPDRWIAADGRKAGCIALFIGPGTSQEDFADNIIVVVTRFIFDHGVDPSDLIDHAYVDARALDRWQEESVARWPASGRHSGWSQQSGRYRYGAQKLYTTTSYTVHKRGNVGYLVQVTATLQDSDAGHPEVVKAIQTVNFVD